MTSASESLQELLACARTPEDFAALDELVQEAERSNATPMPTPDRWMLETLGEVAELFGCAVQTVKQWRTESPPMPGSAGAWPIKEIIRWREGKLKSSDIKAARLRQEFELGEIELEKKRIELARQKAEIFDRADVERWAAVALIETREMVMTLPEVLATSSPPELRESVRSETDRHCRATLAMLRRRLEDTEEIDSTKPEGEPEE